jgi:hypothetical protein
MPRLFGSCGEWIRRTSAHESSSPGSVGMGMEVWSHSIVAVRAVSVGSNATRFPGIIPMRNGAYFNTGMSEKSTGSLEFGSTSCIAGERFYSGRSAEMAFAAASTRSFGTTKYMVWRHEVGTRKVAAHKKSPQRTWAILWWERAREGEAVCHAACQAASLEVGP